MIKEYLDDMGKAVMALYLELPKGIADDVKAKFDNLYNNIADSLIEWHDVENNDFPINDNLVCGIYTHDYKEYFGTEGTIVSGKIIRRFPLRFKQWAYLPKPPLTHKEK